MRPEPERQKHGFSVLGLLGINASPTCGVETTWADDRDQPGPGAFIRLLDEECRARGLKLPMRGIRAQEPAQAVAALAELLKDDTHGQS